MKIPHFYPIVPDADMAGEYILAGVRFLQIRIKELPDKEIKSQLSDIIPFAKKYNAVLVINDYWKHALELDADYIHLGQEDLAAADMNKIKKSGLSLGISTHDEKELKNALSYNPDYIALGPIYHTKLKAMKWEPQGLEKISVWKKKIGNTRLIAIGGITLEKADLVLSNGADSVSVVTDITLADNRKNRLKMWLEKFSHL